MTMQELMDRAELKDLVDTFSNLADVKDAASQGAHNSGIVYFLFPQTQSCGVL